ncbi:MAG: type II toxin-antitoxin system ParD family antitoxin [Bacteroidales bacterium]|nr:type II toxin-antitoxin system ParD family antitoxin [Bacteroidales bacterium]
MGRTVTVSLGPHYEEFIRESIAGGRYNNASEVIRAALRRMEEDEARITALRAALVEGEESGYIEDFNPTEFLNELNEAYDKEIQTI